MGSPITLQRRSLTLAPLLALALLGSAPLAAEPATDDDAPSLAEIRVLGQRLDLDDKELFDLADVRQTGDLGPALDRQSGLETQGLGMGKAWSALAIRGQSFRETSVTLNGAPLPESFNLGTLPTESLGRVHVTEGPRSVEVGGGLGGALDLESRGAEGQRLGLSLSQGSFNTMQYQLSLPTLSLGGFSDALSGSWGRTDGYLPPVTSGFNNLTYPFTDEEHWDLSNVAQWAWDAERLTLSSVYFRHQGSAPDADNVIAAGTDQYDLDGRQDAWGLQSVLSERHPLGGAWSIESRAYGDDSEVLRSNPIGADPTSGMHHPYLNRYLDYGASARLKGASGDAFPALHLGLQGSQQGLDSGLYGQAHGRASAALDAGATWAATRNLSLTLADRVAWSQGFNVYDEPSARLAWEAAPAWRWHLGAGLGTQLPSFDQLYLPATAFANLPPDLAAQYAASPFGTAFAGEKGAPGLEPERMTKLELGSDLLAGPLLLQASAFADLAQGLISAQLDPADGLWTYVNVDRASFVGFEGSLRAQWAGMLLPYLSLTTIDSRDGSGAPLPGRLRLKAGGGFELHPEPSWSLDFNARYVDRVPVDQQILTDLGQPAGASDYWDLSASVRFRVSPHVNGSLTMENLLDAQRASLQGLPLPGRTLRTALQGAF